MYTAARKLYAFAIIALSITQAHGKSIEASGIEACADIGDLAHAVMQHRQDTNDMSDILRTYAEVVDASGNENSAQLRLIMAFIREAYVMPRQPTTEGRARAAQEYATRYTMFCLRAREEEK